MNYPAAPPPRPLLKPAPNSNAEGDFEAEADDFVASMPPFGEGLDALAVNVHGNAVSALASASVSAQQAALAQQAREQAVDVIDAAMAASGAAMWVAGVYAAGVVVWSPSDGRLYRRKPNGGASPTDPADDRVNWYAPSQTNTTPVFLLGLSTEIPAGIKVGIFVLTAPNLVVSLPSGSAAGNSLRLIDRSGSDAPGHTIYLTDSLFDGMADSIFWDIKNGDVTFLQSGPARGWLVLSGRRT